MRIGRIFPLIVFALLAHSVDRAHFASEASAPPLRVGVFEGHGASPKCVQDAVEALRIDPGIEVRRIAAREVLGGALDGLDVVVFPGGGGGRQTNDLGELGVVRVRRFVLEEGKGAVGLCAGAYLLSDTPNYTCLRLCGVSAVDREHDERGRGIVAVRPTPTGLALFPELAGQEKRFLYYYEGPLFEPAEGGAPFEVLATFASDVHLENEAPAGLMPGRPALVRAEAGKGRVVLSSPHPEASPGLRWMVPRMVRWAARRDALPYSHAAVRPTGCDREILYDEKLRKEEEAHFQTLLSGSAKRRAEAIRDLAASRSWAGPLWVTGSLRSAEPALRRAAALALADWEATWALDDVRLAFDGEKEPEARATLEFASARLASMAPAAEADLPERAPRTVAVTFDDLPAVSVPGGRDGWKGMTEKLLRAVREEKVPAVGFVNGSKLVGPEGPEPWRADLLRDWLDAGFELGNHTYAHLSFHRVSTEEFLADIRRGDATLRPLLAERGKAPKYFRHPMLHAGRTQGARDAAEDLIRELGYRDAPVTFDHSEWIFAAAYARALERGEAETAGRVREAYIPYMLARVAYFERQSRALFGREVAQVLLLHANQLNADTFGDLAGMLRGRGYSFETLDKVLEDPAYALSDGYFGPAGISWLHRWCFTLGGRYLVVPDEPRCPQWILDYTGFDE